MSTDRQILDYCRRTAAETGLTRIVETPRNMSTQLMTEMFSQILNMKATRDEVAYPLERIRILRRGPDNKLAIWAAGSSTANLLMQEFPLGFIGLFAMLPFADLLQQVGEHCWNWERRESFSLYGHVQGLTQIPGAMDRTMVARGVFKETIRFRPQPMEAEAPRPAGPGQAGGGGARNATPSDERKPAIVAALNEYLKRYLRA